VEERGVRLAAPTHFPSLEGIRALAASLIVLYHAAALSSAGLTGADAGPPPRDLGGLAAVLDVGVAVFFVLSGFLIYRPFARAHLDATPRRGVRTYLWRRAVRIFPAYWLALTVLWAWGVIDLGTWSTAWRYYALVHIYDAHTVFSGIVQAWSLGTEVTFYLLVPVWAAAVRRVGGGGRRALAAELAGVAVLVLAGYASRAAFSASGRIWAGQDVTMRAVSFTWLPNHVDLFALGMGLAVVSLATERGLLPARWAMLAGRWPAAWWAAAVGLYVWYAWWIGPPPFREGYIGLNWQRRQLTYGLIGFCLLVPAVFGDQARGLLRRGLQWPPVVVVGVVSYGLYLWHNDLMKQVPDWLDTPPGATNLAALLAVGFGLGLACAAASFYGLERPLGRLRRRRA